MTTIATPVRFVDATSATTCATAEAIRAGPNANTARTNGDRPARGLTLTSSSADRCGMADRVIMIDTIGIVATGGMTMIAADMTATGITDATVTMGVIGIVIVTGTETGIATIATSPNGAHGLVVNDNRHTCSKRAVERPLVSRFPRRLNS